MLAVPPTPPEDGAFVRWYVAAVVVELVFCLLLLAFSGAFGP